MAKSEPGPKMEFSRDSELLKVDIVTITVSLSGGKGRGYGHMRRKES